MLNIRSKTGLGFVRSRSGFNLRTNSIAAAKTSKVLRNEKTKGREQKEGRLLGTGLPSN
jgi:hypothetical protein